MNKKLVWKTFNEWSNLGYLILKGSKATVVNNKLKFNNRQIKRKSPNRFAIRTANGNTIGAWENYTDGHWENGVTSDGEEGGYSPEMYG